MALIHMTFRSQTLKRETSLNVVIPFDRGHEGPYPTLYLLHGLSDFEGSWLANSRISRWAIDRGLAVVMPAGDNSFYVNVGEAGSVYGDFGAYVGEELVEATRAVFPLARERERTFIGGFSMGGFGALRNGLAYAPTFGKIAVFAAADHFFEDDPSFARGAGNTKGETYIFEPLEQTRESALNPRWIAGQLALQAKAEGVPASEVIPSLRIRVGEEDNLLATNQNVAAGLAELGANVDFGVGKFGHDWDFIDSELPAMLDWLVG